MREDNMEWERGAGGTQVTQIAIAQRAAHLAVGTEKAVIL